jgi:hypothetical protein
MKRLLTVLLTVLATSWAHAQMPSTEEMLRATAASVDLARQSGVALRTGTLWLAALRERAPLVAAYGQGVCQLGYSPYTPGRDYRWLFPTLTPAQREAWLVGIVHHELAHCAEQAAQPQGRRGAQAITDGGPGHRWHEVLADRAFAMHVDRASANGEALVRLMADLRASQHAGDPDHDTSVELNCYLQHRAATVTEAPWLARLQAWRQRCWSGPAPAAPS